MNKKFTKLIAALALLVFMTPSMVMWGQTRAEGDTHEFPQTLSQLLNNNASIDPIEIEEQSYPVKKVTISYRYNKTFQNAVTMEVEVNGTSWGTQYANGTGSNYVTVDFEGTSTTGDIVISFTNNTGSGTGHGTFYVDKVILTEGPGSGTPTTVTIDASGITNTDVYTSTVAGSLSATVKDNDNNVISGATVSWESSDENVATIDANGIVTLVAAGTTTITANYDGVANQYQASSDDYELVVTSSAPYVQPNPVEINMNYLWLGSVNGSNLNSNQLPVVKTDDNVTTTITDGTSTRPRGDADYIRIYKGSTLTFAAPTGYEITSIVFTTGGTNTWNAPTVSTGTLSDKTWAGHAESVEFTLTGTCFISKVTITLAEPSTEPSVIAEDVSIAYDAEEGTINYTINNPVAGGTLTAFCDAEWIEVDDTQQTDAEGSIDFICYPNSNFYAHIATVTLTYTYNDSKATVTKNITVTQAGDPDANGSTAEFPINVSEAIEAIDEVGTVSNIYVGGIVSNIHTAYYNGYITFDMIDEIGNEYFLRAYKCTGDDAAEVAVGDEVVVCGNLFLYNNSIYEFQQNCELVSLTHPVVPTITVSPDLVEVNAEDHDGTLALTYQYLTISAMTDLGIQYYDAAGEEISTNNEPSWIEVLVAEQDPNEGVGYVVSYTIFENDDEARTAYFKVFAFDADNEPVYSNLVTVNQAAPVLDYAILPFEWAGGTRADFIAQNGCSSSSLDNDYAVTNAPYRIKFNADGNYLQIKTDSRPGNVTIGVKLFSSTTSSSKITVQGSADGITFTDIQELTITGSQNTTQILNATNAFAADHRYVRLYFTKGNGSNVGVGPITIAKSYTLSINAHTANGGWYLIASPVTVDPVAAGMITDNLSGDDLTPETSTYELYAFDNNQEAEWRNYRSHAFNLEPGKGYLYASKNGGNFTLSGTPYSGDGEITLLSGSTTNTGSLANWNLVGNPYPVEAEISSDYYAMKADGTDVEVKTADNNVDPMQGVFVVYDAEHNTSVIFEPVTETPTAPDGNDKFILNVSQNRGNVIDRAIVRMGEGRQLPKFQLFENSTKVYIPQNGKDYAIVSTEAQGELPVNFRASENGTYTLSIDAENVEMNYLHLIDNMTGMDVDLLQTPSYTFDANTRDYESRFRLVFAGASTGSATDEPFAFFSNGNLIINNEGIATLQVIDITGRILSSESVNGSVSTTLNATPGVYMLRLINGENVKVQKIVVR